MGLGDARSFVLGAPGFVPCSGGGCQPRSWVWDAALSRERRRVAGCGARPVDELRRIWDAIVERKKGLAEPSAARDGLRLRPGAAPMRRPLPPPRKA